MLVTGIVLISAVAAGALYQFIGAMRSARAHAPPGMMIDVDGRGLHIVCEGRGRPAVLFESAVAASSLSWSRVLPSVAKITQACAYDRAGLGWSDSPRGPRTLERMVGNLRALVTNAAIQRPYVLVGHSFGAFLVCAYASLYPDDVAGVVLLDPPSEWRHMTREQARLLWGGIQLSRFGGVLARVGVVRACLALLSGGAPGVPRNFVRVFGPRAAHTLERLVGEVRKLPPNVHPVVQALWSQPKCFRAMADHLRALAETGAFVARLTSLPDVPVIVISSADQPPETVAAHRDLAHLSAQGRHMTATQSGHWIQFDQPDLVVSAIGDVVDRARARSA
jgi:pimeloyl-ACP methyl ester carboxylesterase